MASKKNEVNFMICPDCGYLIKNKYIEQIALLKSKHEKEIVEMQDFFNVFKTNDLRLSHINKHKKAFEFLSECNIREVSNWDIMKQQRGTTYWYSNLQIWEVIEKMLKEKNEQISDLKKENGELKKERDEAYADVAPYNEDFLSKQQVKEAIEKQIKDLYKKLVGQKYQNDLAQRLDELVLLYSRVFNITYQEALKKFSLDKKEVKQ